MRIYTKIVCDWDGNVLYSESYDYAGPIILLKGNPLTEAAAKTGVNNSNTEFNNATNLQNQVTPMLTAEATNPQGLGYLGLTGTTNAGAQGIAGAEGAGKEEALLRASRSGNPSSTASIIDAITRSGITAQGNNALKTNLANNDLKLEQQQQGITGLTGMGNTDLSSAMNYLGLGTTASNDYAQQQQAAFNGIFGPIMGSAGAVAGAFTGK